MQVEFGRMEKLSSWCSEMNNYYTDYSKEQISGFDTPKINYRFIFTWIQQRWLLMWATAGLHCHLLIKCSIQHSQSFRKITPCPSFILWKKIQLLVCSTGHDSIFFKVDSSYWTCSWICGFVQNLYGNVSFLSNILLWRMLKWNFSWSCINLFTKSQLVSRHSWELSFPESGISPAPSSLNCWAIDYYKVGSSFYCFVFPQTFGSSSFHLDAKWQPISKPHTFCPHRTVVFWPTLPVTDTIESYGEYWNNFWSYRIDYLTTGLLSFVGYRWWSVRKILNCNHSIHFFLTGPMTRKKNKLLSYLHF